MPTAKNKFGDPMPVIQHRVDAATQARARRDASALQISCSRGWRRPTTGACGQVSALNYQDHPAGGCRMGTDPATSVVNSHGRTHDHENLFIVGSPTLPDRRLHQRHTDVRGARAAIGDRDRPELNDRALVPGRFTNR